MALQDGIFGSGLTGTIIRWLTLVNTFHWKP